MRHSVAPHPITQPKVRVSTKTFCGLLISVFSALALLLFDFVGRLWALKAVCTGDLICSRDAADNLIWWSAESLTTGNDYINSKFYNVESDQIAEV